MPSPMISLSVRLADEQLADVLAELAVYGPSEPFFASLTYTEASAMADFLLAHDNPAEAGKFMASWAQQDEDWEENNGDGDLDSWFDLIPETDRQWWLDQLTRGDT